MAVRIMMIVVIMPQFIYNSFAFLSYSLSAGTATCTNDTERERKIKGNITLHKYPQFSGRSQDAAHGQGL